MNPSSIERQPINITQKPHSHQDQNMAASLVFPVQDTLDISSTYTRPSAISSAAKNSFYLPTPPSTSPPSPRHKQLPTTVLSPFTSGSAESVMLAKIKALNDGNELEGDGDEGAFFVGDLGEVYKAWRSWVTELSRVELFYGAFCIDSLNKIDVNILTQLQLAFRLTPSRLSLQPSNVTRTLSSSSFSHSLEPGSTAPPRLRSSPFSLFLLPLLPLESSLPTLASPLRSFGPPSHSVSMP